MKFPAAILAALILTLSAGANAGVRHAAPEAAAPECCCCCGDTEEGTQEQRQDAPSEGKCPFCLNNNCPAFTATFPTHYEVCLTRIGHKENILILHKYNNPLIKGIWQPPRLS